MHGGYEIIAIDDGYDFTKVRSRAGELLIPTAFSLTPTYKKAVIGDSENVESVYDINGKRVAVGPKVVGMDSRFEEYPYSEENLAVAMDALRRVAAPGAPVHIVTGLPFNRYYLPNGQENPLVPDRKTKAWSRPIQLIDAEVALPRIAGVHVIAEGVAAWFDYVLTDDGEMIPQRMSEFTAVVDIGGRTTDIAVFQDDQLNPHLSGTHNHGMLDVKSAIGSKLEELFPGTEFDRSRIDHALKTNEVKLGGGRTVNVSTVVTESRAVLFEGIERYMRSKIGNHMPLIDRVIFVGGGAKALNFELTHTEVQKRFNNPVIHPFAQFANARGMLKYGYAHRRFASENAA
jgi:plasmid segregation protein ParM